MNNYNCCLSLMNKLSNYMLHIELTAFHNLFKANYT